MAVYVDDMHLTPMGRLGRMKMCHMVADTEEELHAMAEQLGVRQWYQYPEKSRYPHYDIAMSKRALAVQLGAKEISMKGAVVISKACRDLIKGAAT
ncbi:hypothetical protein FDI24_gp208 [Acidovorax phage ACP17]|uniref:DUF4031 domain-containing protein n=1 Tax=Acidovorax phage ACP17 TaxID=2010329 RepID=A0A218M379_9CAUD|nr:hypothetical protein FDI24_gp208 [Acidovorax phage ACP17]ASD50489.1 hypothetical protein [Acidovorax phage ACP17]